MNIQLTQEQVGAIVSKVVDGPLEPVTQLNLAKRVLRRRENLNSIEVLRQLVRQVAREHAMTIEYVLKELK